MVVPAQSPAAFQECKHCVVGIMQPAGDYIPAHTALPIKMRHCSVEAGRFMCRQQLSAEDGRCSNTSHEQPALSTQLPYSSSPCTRAPTSAGERSLSKSGGSCNLVDCMLQLCRLHAYSRISFYPAFFHQNNQALLVEVTFSFVEVILNEGVEGLWDAVLQSVWSRNQWAAAHFRFKGSKLINEDTFANKTKCCHPHMTLSDNLHPSPFTLVPCEPQVGCILLPGRIYARTIRAWRKDGHSCDLLSPCNYAQMIMEQLQKKRGKEGEERKRRRWCVKVCYHVDTSFPVPLLCERVSVLCSV